MVTRVKFISKNPLAPFQLELPAPPFEDIVYTQDPEATDYDWLVVYDDLPPLADERFSKRQEILSCPRENTILITYEPASVKVYGHDYTHQYGVVLTSHAPHELAHPARRDVPPVGIWYYGDDTDMAHLPTPPEKNYDLSIFMSAKADSHTVHALRYNFFEASRDYFGDRATYFGRQYNYVEKKATGLDGFKYTLALENHIGPHHWTEKLSDAYLGYCMPIYDGCSNLDDYFPADSYLKIDMRDPAEAFRQIEAAIADDVYRKALPSIVEARRRVIEDYNLPMMIGQAIRAAEQATASSRYIPNNGGRIISRRARRLKTPFSALRYAYEKIKSRINFYRQNRAYRQN